MSLLRGVGVPTQTLEHANPVSLRPERRAPAHEPGARRETRFARDGFVVGGRESKAGIRGKRGGAEEQSILVAVHFFFVGFGADIFSIRIHGFRIAPTALFLGGGHCCVSVELGFAVFSLSLVDGTVDLVKESGRERWG